MTTRMRSLGRRLVPRRLYLAVRDSRAELAWFAHTTQHRLGVVRHVDMPEGWRATCHPSSLAVFEAFRDDPEYRAEFDAFVGACTPGMVLVDVGANMGFFTVTACHFGGPAARVIAVEPSARPAAVLLANVALAGRAASVTLERRPVGAGEDRLPLLLEGAAGGFQFMRPLEPRADVQYVTATTVDELVERSGLTPTHLKVDVEGFEEPVLRGARRCIERHHPLLMLELHGHLLRAAGRRPEDVLALVADFGYDDLSWHGQPVTPAAAAAMWIARLMCRHASPSPAPA